MPNVMNIDDYDLEEAREIVAAFGTERYGYVVTPNVDHVIRHYDDAQFRSLYASAAYILLDSRFLAHIVGLFKRQRLRVFFGSDSDDICFVLGHQTSRCLGPGRRDPRTGTDSTCAVWAQGAGQHVDPPMNFICDAAAVDACLSAIEAVRILFRFCFLAVGSPQQEVIAHKLKVRGGARGFALCIGASINYITGNERRAPLVDAAARDRMGISAFAKSEAYGEALLVRGPRIFLLLSRIQLRLRPPIPTPVGKQIGASGCSRTLPLLRDRVSFDDCVSSVLCEPHH